jgi:orotate phosphoribosyltransferase
MTSTSSLAELMNIRRGHFRLASGHHGALWLDLDAFLRRPKKARPFIDALSARLAAYRFDGVCGPLTGGAFIAQAIAANLGVDFHYADVADSRRGLRPSVEGRRLAVVDDAINAGSALRATFGMLERGGATPVVIGALLVLGEHANGLAGEKGVALERLEAWPNQIWEPSACPLCAAGTPLEHPDMA